MYPQICTLVPVWIECLFDSLGCESLGAIDGDDGKGRGQAELQEGGR